MHRRPILQLLNTYEPYDSDEVSLKEKIINFITYHPDCFERTCREGHITASAWITNAMGDRFLMTLHKKLKLWLPLGGHADGDCDIHRAALKEAREESGLKSLAFVSKDIFDICIADYITPTEPFHQHYDFNFLLQIRDRNDQIKISEESIDLQWFSELPESARTIGNINENINRLYTKWKRWMAGKAKNGKLPK